MDSKILHWSFRDLHDFPEALLEHGDSVEEVYLKENFIRSLPAWLFNCTYLRFIQLCGNLLSQIPDGIGELENLESLDVSKNRLTELPMQMCHLNKLRYLNVSNNSLTTMHPGRNSESIAFNFIETYIKSFPYQFQSSVKWNHWNRWTFRKIA